MAEKMTIAELKKLVAKKRRQGGRIIKAKPTKIPEDKLRKHDRIYIEQEKTKKELELV